MATSFQQAHSEAWSKVGVGTKDRPFEVFPKYTKRNFDDLKADYNSQYGYTVRIPQWDDIVHLVPNAFKSKEQIKAEKKEALVRILDSPAPEWARDFASVMTWIDDVQDTASIVYPLLKLLTKVAPKAMSRLMPLVGWLTAGYDILNILNAIGRAPLTPMKSKRTVCKAYRQNPFSKTARYLRVENIKNWKPNLADVIQAAQVSDQFTGFGLSLGGVMGAITDTIYGAYRYATGEPVKFSFDPPDVGLLDQMGARGLRASQAISSQGQVFSEMQHFWTYITGALSTISLCGTFREGGMAELVVDPMNIMLPAPEPKDPLTLEVIKDLGLKVEDGIAWPFNGEKFISAGDLLDATAEPCRANFVGYCSRHSKDSYGFLAAAALDTLVPNVILAIDPEAGYEMDDTTEMKIFWKMIKAPILPVGPFTKEQSDTFWKWGTDYNDLYGNTPGILEIESKLDQLNIKHAAAYPAEPGPD